MGYLLCARHRAKHLDVSIHLIVTTTSIKSGTILLSPLHWLENGGIERWSNGPTYLLKFPERSEITLENTRYIVTAGSMVRFQAP